MEGRSIGICAVAAAMLGSAGCKPPPSDAAVARAANLPVLPGPSVPQPSPDTTDAVWAQSAKDLRLVYGVPGQPVLLALECVGTGPLLRITRHAPADRDAEALLAIIGNRRAARIAVAATRTGDRLLWQGEAPAIDPDWDTLGDQREVTATIPGAGLLKLNASPLPKQLVEQCRKRALPADPA
jgi:hypothetical protein